MFRWNRYTKPDKPKTQKAKLDMLWDAVYNDIFHWMHWQDVKLNFVLVFLALLLACLGKLLLS